MPVLLYWLGIKLYTLFVKVAVIFNAKAKLFVQGRKDLLQHIHYSLIDERRHRIWMHCASLGEFEQGRPLLEKLRRQYPDSAFVLTFFSPSGYEMRKNYSGADYVFYLPLDTPNNAREFLASVKPSLAVFVKYDLWYFYLSKMAELNIPLLLVSAIFRNEQPFFKWYGKLHRSMLHMFTHIFVQDEVSVKMLNKIGVWDVTVAGDTRFDRVAEVALNAKPIAQIADFCTGNKVIVAGSTWPADEQLLKQVIDKLPTNWKIIIVPHEVHTTHIKQLAELFRGEAILWSAFKEYYDQRILIIDTMGLLIRLYQYADVTYVGGGFNSSGIHNILEAAVYGKPVFHGPTYHKFKEARDLNEKGAAIAVNSAEKMLQQMLAWETDRIGYNAACVTAEKYVSANTGATATILNYVAGKELLSKV
jgi:3-deoxy-D-manno-octulosonic-acid transferase